MDAEDRAQLVGTGFPARFIKWAIFRIFLVSPIHSAHAAITLFSDSCQDGRMFKQPFSILSPCANNAKRGGNPFSSKW
jgi:hypothetical protein